MHRSSSTSRIRGDHHLSYHSLSSEVDELPMYDPSSEAAKKEKGGARFAENAIHVIPFVLLFCAFVLWFFSNPDVVELHGNLLAANIQGKTIELGDLDIDGTGNLPVDLGDLDPTELVGHTLISESRS